ncbi:MAG: squalene--hopene cyclase [Kiritimatiellae bacterium]|nr:squalene--hopene cyclase [Kiritimatiellia bacterium]
MTVQYSTSSSEKVLEKLKAELFSRQEASGYWRGNLSSSALSTAVGLFALAMVDYARYRSVILGGLQWLQNNVNDDGGWGDTIRSKSNLSTTLLVWAALNCSEELIGDFTDTKKSAAIWIDQQVGGLEPEKIITAVVGCYGKDKTFAVPILAMLTMAGRLGPLPNAWRKVSQLPFELSVLPQSFFKWLRLPVVSYALPALIAIGVVRHNLAPSRNPFTRLIRNLVITKALKVLENIQPANGGFLEAAPLTGFVVMSLSAAGCGDCLVAERGADFLTQSARSDGSWPIDTDLATWVTTLAINALDVKNDFQPEKWPKVKRWLLDQQFTKRHPFTGAAPGGWGWTNLPGSVPDADDTAGALLALRRLPDEGDVEVMKAVESGLGWLLGVQNSDGGIPTFCKGWGLLPFDMSCPDITAHAINAITVWFDCMDEDMRRQLTCAKGRMLKYLEVTQQKNGAWLPLWFGNENAIKNMNPVYGTARVLSGISSGEVMTEGGYKFLCGVQNDDGGWGGDVGVASSVEETALAIIALFGSGNELYKCEAERGTEWLLNELADVEEIKATAIGLYFASLWYYEDIYPLVFAIAALQAETAWRKEGIKL